MPLQFRRGSDAQLSSITPLAGEPIWTTDTRKLYVGDGVTPGGFLAGGYTGSRGYTGSQGQDGDRYHTTSTSTNTIVNNGSLTFYTADLNLDYSTQQTLIIAYNAANHMHGTVTTYNPATGELVVDIKGKTGSGTYSSWEINLDGAVGIQGYTGSAGTNGYTGSASTVAGPQGPQGTTGYTGSAGTGYTGSAAQYNQSLNTTDSVQFASVTATTSLVIGTYGITISGFSPNAGLQFSGAAYVPNLTTGGLSGRDGSGPVDLTIGSNVVPSNNSKDIGLSCNPWRRVYANTATVGALQFTSDGIAITSRSQLVGYTGSAGAGATGYTGSVGTQGTAGATGYTGSSGAGTTGYTGSAGTNGTNGATGYTGSASTVAGPTGPQGATGYTGSAGSSPSAYTMNYLLVAGGGGGGSNYGGGGGAGGATTASITVFSGQVYQVVVGSGGPAGLGCGVKGTSGNNSSISLLGSPLASMLGGGGGGTNGVVGNYLGISGGSGGGGGGQGSVSNAGGSGTTGQGNSGGSSNSASPFTGGGGGGYGYAGSSAGTLRSGGGGLSSAITGTNFTWAGGGGGGSENAASGSPGGAGGGGNGGWNRTNAPTAGQANLGGGGGGGPPDAWSGGQKSGAAGGGGVVVLSVPWAAWSRTTTGTVTTSTVGSNVVMQFTGAGSYTA